VRSQAAKELLAPVEDVWAYVSEPYNFADWWTGIGGVRPDRRGFSEGARWTLFQGSEPGLLQKPGAPRMLVVTAIDPFKRFAFHLPRDRLDCELQLEPLRHDHTQAALAIDGPFLVGLRQHSLARGVLQRLFDLLQTAAPASN
jgi:uncharacterized protein YndB with AHSA1/START domain